MSETKLPLGIITDTIKTDDGASTDALNISTGNASSGNSGSINIVIGTATGTRGNLTVDNKDTLIDSSGKVELNIGTSLDIRDYSAGASKPIRFYGSSGQYTGIKANGLGNFDLILPDSAGTSGQTLTSNGSGAMTWEDRANTSLSNLSTTAINTDLIFNTVTDSIIQTTDQTTPDSIPIQIKSGNSTNNTGYAVLRSGDSTAAASGTVLVRSGSGATASGDVILETGGGTGTRGVVSLKSENIDLNVTNAIKVKDLNSTSAKPIRFYDDSQLLYVGLKAPSTVNVQVDYSLPTQDGSFGDMLITDGSGNLSWAPVTGANDTLSNLSSPVSINQNLLPSDSWDETNPRNLGASTKTWATSYISYITNSTEVCYLDLDGNDIYIGGNAVILEPSTTLNLNAATSVSVTTPILDISGDGANSTIVKFWNPTSTNYTGLKASSSPTDTVFILPSSDGVSGQVLTTDGSGNLSWTVGIEPLTTYTSGPQTLTLSQKNIVCNGTFTINLPAAASSAGKVYNIKNKGSGTITVDANSSETIDGSATLTLTVQYESYTIICDGTEWFII